MTPLSISERESSYSVVLLYSQEVLRTVEVSNQDLSITLYRDGGMFLCSSPIICSICDGTSDKIIDAGVVLYSK